MLDVFEQDELRIRGPLRFDAAIIERARQDAQIQAALKIEAEQRAAQHRQAEARQAEAQMIAAADDVAAEKLAALQSRYQQRQEAARVVIEAVSALWRIEQEIRDGESDAYRALSDTDVLLNGTQRGERQSALRARADLPSQHIFIAPKQWCTTDAQRAGAAAVAALTSGYLGPGFVRVRNEVIDFG